MAGRRHKPFWVVVSATLVAAIGVLSLVHAIRFDPEAVKAELQGRIAEYKLIPEDDFLRRDAFLEGLLGNPSYKEHAKALYRDVERAHARVHEPAALELEAKKTVPPFLARCRDLSKVPADELHRLHDESRSHLTNYGTTRQAAPLREVQARLGELLDQQDKVTPRDFVELTKSALDLANAGRFAEAAALIAAFRKRPGSADYAGKIRELEEMLSRKAAAAVKPR